MNEVHRVRRSFHSSNLLRGSHIQARVLALAPRALTKSGKQARNSCSLSPALADLLLVRFAPPGKGTAMSEEEKKMALALREWALKRVFGPALTEIEEDLRKLYAKGRDKLILAAYRKVRNPDDGKQANLRVMRDVLWNG